MKRYMTDQFFNFKRYIPVRFRFSWREHRNFADLDFSGEIASVDGVNKTVLSFNKEPGEDFMVIKDANGVVVDPFNIMDMTILHFMKVRGATTVDEHGNKLESLDEIVLAIAIAASFRANAIRDRARGITLIDRSKDLCHASMFDKRVPDSYSYHDLVKMDNESSANIINVNRIFGILPDVNTPRHSVAIRDNKFLERLKDKIDRDNQEFINSGTGGFVMYPGGLRPMISAFPSTLIFDVFRDNTDILGETKDDKDTNKCEEAKSIVPELSESNECENDNAPVDEKEPDTESMGLLGRVGFMFPGAEVYVIWRSRPVKARVNSFSMYGEPKDDKIGILLSDNDNNVNEYKFPRDRVFRTAYDMANWFSNAARNEV
jgi:hypothetical protein